MPPVESQSVRLKEERPALPSDHLALQPRRKSSSNAGGAYEAGLSGSAPILRLEIRIGDIPYRYAE